jgi:hypothetical protein
MDVCQHSVITNRIVPNVLPAALFEHNRSGDRLSLAPVGMLVLCLRCSWCPGSAPMPKLIGLFALPPARRAQTAYGGD